MSFFPTKTVNRQLLLIQYHQWIRFEEDDFDDRMDIAHVTQGYTHCRVNTRCPKSNGVGDDGRHLPYVKRDVTHILIKLLTVVCPFINQYLHLVLLNVLSRPECLISL